MKQLILWVSLALISTNVYCQTNQLNQQKYWKLRDGLREDFVKISNEVGGSIVARALRPNYCFNNIVDSPGNGGFSMGEMLFGDGMIRQGYYLSLLATEYKLLKDAGQDTRGVLNELYYALGAINRLDLSAEPEQSATYEFFFPGSLNGFYMREDIPEDFANQNWGNTDMRMECVNSPHFKTNNAQKLNAEATATTPKLEAHPNSYQNSPSMDQLSSLMVGFRLVHKLVDNVPVRPTLNDDTHYLVTETQAIVNRIMTYIEDHNWMMIDVNGWPVNNGGGDCIWAAYPLYLAAFQITGNQYNNEWTRRLESFYLSKMQYCITGYGTENNSEEGQLQACNIMNLSPYYHPLTYNDLLSGANPGVDNNQNESSYQDWLSSGALHGGIDLFFNFWNDPLDDLNDYWDGDGIDLDLPTTAVKILDIVSDDSGLDDGNFGILSSNLAVASGVWSSPTMYNVTQQTGNVVLNLINALLREETPHGTQSFYKGYIDEMPVSGPYFFSATDPTGTVTIQNGASNHWASEHRWTFGTDADDGGQNAGLYNGLDYMLFHNLYRILYPNMQDPITPEIAEECYCNDQIEFPMPTNIPNPSLIPIVEYLKTEIDLKLAHVPVCTENIFENVNNEIGSYFKIAPYFPQYSDMEIYTNKFQTENALVQFPGGHIDVRTPFILCNNSTLTFEPNTVMKITQKHVSVNAGSTIDLSGELYVQPGTELRVKSGAHLILRAGSKLILHENCKVIIEQGANLTYYKDAIIYTKNDDSGQLIIKGNLNLENNAVFSIDHSFSTNSGLIVFDGKPQINAKPGARIDITAKSKNDIIMRVNDNTKVYFSDPDLVEVYLTDCGVDLNSVNSFIRFEQRVNTLRAKFKGNNVYAGQVYVTDVNLFRQTDFVNTHVGAELDIENNATLRMVSCNFTQELPYYENGSGIDVHGRGYNLTSCNFNIYANGNGMVESQKLTINSNVSGCSFADVTSSTTGETAIYDASNVEIRVASSNFNNLRNAIDKSTGKLTLRCNNFNNSRDNSVTMRGGLLNMAIGAGGGYNTFTAMTGTLSTRSHIYLEKALIDMTFGSNYLRDVPVTGGLVRGTLQTTCASAGACNLDFSGNQWNPVFLITPSNARFSIKSANNINVTVNTIVPMQKASCGSLDQIYGLVSVVGATTNLILGQIPTYYSAIMGQTKRLDQGIQEAMNRMTALNDGNGNDLEAIAYLDEIFRSNISYSSGTALTQKLLLEAKSHMKLALESAMAADLITPDQNLYNFDANTDDFVNSTNKVTSSVVTENNYFKQFYNELDKAQVLRAIGQAEKSLELLTELELCGLDFMEQSLVNREKIYALKDLRIAELGMSFLDTLYVPDTSSFILPVNYSGDYHFGSIIQSLNSIDYQNCFGSKSLITEPDNRLEVFPNPASEELTIRFSYQAMEGLAIIQIYQQDGRLMTSSTLNENVQGEWTTNVSEWSPGTYQYVFIRPDGTRYSGVFVVM